MNTGQIKQIEHKKETLEETVIHNATRHENHPRVAHDTTCVCRGERLEWQQQWMMCQLPA